MSLEADELVKEVLEKHTDHAFYIVSSEVNGLRDIAGCNNVLSMKITYAESSEALTKRDFKQMKFWMYKKEAVGLGEFILEAARPSREASEFPEK